MLFSEALEIAETANNAGWESPTARALVVVADVLARTAAGKWQVVPGRVYIAGPMTGLPELNFPAFHAAAAELRAKGYDIINPAEVNPDPNAKWVDCMRADIRELMTCTGIYMLPGWRASRGASLEYFLANALNLTILNERPGLTIAAAAMAANIPCATVACSPIANSAKIVAIPGANSATLGGAGA